MRETPPKWLRRDELLAEERRLESRLELIRRIKREFGLRDDAAGGEPTRVRVRGGTGTRRKGRRGWFEEIVGVLAERGRALHWREVYAALQERSPTLNWKAPSAMVRSYVGRARKAGDRRVEAVGRGTYGLTAWREGGVDDQGGERQPR